MAEAHEWEGSGRANYLPVNSEFGCEAVPHLNFLQVCCWPGPGPVRHGVGQVDSGCPFHTLQSVKYLLRSPKVHCRGVWGACAGWVCRQVRFAREAGGFILDAANGKCSH